MCKLKTCAIAGAVVKYVAHLNGGSMVAGRGAAGIVMDADNMMPMPARRHFIRKLLRNFAIATTIIGGGLFLGMAGYHEFGRLNWSESFYYAAMILSGEGPPPD